MHPAPRRLLPLLALAACALTAAPAVARAESVGSLKKQFLVAAQQEKIDDAAAALEAIAKEGGRAAVDALVDLTAGTPVDRLYRAGILALAGIDDEKGVETLCRRLGSGSVQERIVAATVCANREDEKTFAALIEAVDARKPPLRRRVTQALVARRDKRAIEPLIALLEKVEGKPGDGAGLIRRALRRLTGEELSAAVEWRSFWAARGEAFELPDPDAEKAEEQVAEVRATAVRFFGRELDSDRIVFVIDISGSMLEEDSLPVGERPTTGDGPGATSSRVRLDRAKAELVGALGALPKTAKFNIVAYSGYQAPNVPHQDGQPTEKTWLQKLGPKMMKATGGNVKKAEKFVASLQAAGATFTGRALLTALEIEDAELIVLLSDGEPTEWELQDGFAQIVHIDQIRKRVRTANRFQRLTIDTFGFEGTSRRDPSVISVTPAGFVDFMKGLAEDNAGFYSRIE